MTVLLRLRKMEMAFRLAWCATFWTSLRQAEARSAAFSVSLEVAGDSTTSRTSL